MKRHSSVWGVFLSIKGASGIFTLKGPVASNTSTDLEDSGYIKMALTSLGYYDDTETGLAPYGDRELFQAIKSFQRNNNLKVDGVIKPDGPTQKTIKESLAKDKASGNAFEIFLRNRENMMEADTIGADKYFHCMANYQATESGWGGEAKAKILSAGRELLWAPKEIYQDGFKAAMQDSAEDNKANKHGRETAKSGKHMSAREACAIFRPRGLDEKY